MLFHKLEVRMFKVWLWKEKLFCYLFVFNNGTYLENNRKNFILDHKEIWRQHDKDFYSL